MCAGFCNVTAMELKFYLMLFFLFLVPGRILALSHCPQLQILLKFSYATLKGLELCRHILLFYHLCFFLPSFLNPFSCLLQLFLPWPSQPGLLPILHPVWIPVGIQILQTFALRYSRTTVIGTSLILVELFSMLAWHFSRRLHGERISVVVFFKLGNWKRCGLPEFSSQHSCHV